MSTTQDSIEKLQHDLQEAFNKVISEFAEKRDSQRVYSDIGYLQASSEGSGEFRLEWHIKAKIRKKEDIPKD